MIYPIAIEPGDTTQAYGVVVPDLPGCFSAGDTLEEAIENAGEAILLHLEALVEEGKAPPQPASLETHQRNPDYAGWLWVIVEVDLAKLEGNKPEIFSSRKEMERLEAMGRQFIAAWERAEVKETSLYDQDFYLWTQHQAALLAEQRFAELDLENLIEEVDSIGRNERIQLSKHLTRLLEHLLKWRYTFPEQTQDKDGWIDTIGQARTAIELIIEASPSLKSYLSETLARSYQWATRLNRPIRHRFPEQCPWTIEQVLDDDFFPEPSL